MGARESLTRGDIGSDVAGRCRYAGNTALRAMRRCKPALRLSTSASQRLGRSLVHVEWWHEIPKKWREIPITFGGALLS